MDNRGVYYVRVKMPTGRYSCFAIIGPGKGARHTAHRVADYLNAHPDIPGPVVVHNTLQLTRNAGRRWATAKLRAQSQVRCDWDGAAAVVKACRPTWARCSIMA